MGQLFPFIILYLFPFLLSSEHVPADLQANAIEGRWLRADKKNYIIEIYLCGDRYCGKIIWMKEPNDENGSPRKDLENPDKQLRGLPLLGLDVLENFAYAGDQKWKDGTIYSFNRGKKYNASLSLEGQELKLTASILFFSKTYTWIKAD